MEPFWNEVFANAGSRHQDGASAKKAVEDSRETISKILEVKSEEVIFTSGGTESNSLAIIGFLNYLREEGRLGGAHIITSTTEHPSVLEAFQRHQKKGLKVDFVPVLSDGLVDLNRLKEMVGDKTVLVSIAYVNSEIGVVQPLREISNLIKKKNPKTVFHTDASQAPVFLDIKVSRLGVDMMTLDGQKIYGPKGVGVLYKSSGVNLSPVLLGGSQEGGLRPGTENTPLIVGIAKALEIAELERLEVVEKILPLRNHLIDSLFSLSDKIFLNGSREHRSAGNVNISVIGEDSEFLFVKLDKEGVSCSTKSACINKHEEGSYVLQALGNDDRKSGLRFSLGKNTTKKEIDKVVEILRKILS